MKKPVCSLLYFVFLLTSAFLFGGCSVFESVSDDAPNSQPIPCPAAPCARLSWRDASDNEAGFNIERRNVDEAEEFAKIAMVMTNVSNYTDTTVTANQTYCYRVNAFNLAGTSAYSNEACALMSSTGIVNVVAQ